MVIDLKESRAKIDKIDKEIASLFEERMKVATDVAAYKRSTGKKVFDPAREEEKIHALRELTQDEFNKTGIEDLFRQIMSISRKYQYKVLGSETNEILPFKQVDKLDVDKDTRIVCFGEHGAYTEQAMEEVFGTDITSMNRLSFKEVLETVANGEAKYGVIPIENTSTGGINDTYDLLLDYDITIVAEHVVKVEQALLGKPGAKVSDIKKVYSHPQGIMQCSKFIKEHNMESESYMSTSSAAKKVAEEDDISQGNLYVLEDAVADEAIIHAVFAFIEGEDPVYLKIEQGSWMVDTEYAAVHRVASDGTVRNVLEKIMDYCKAQIPHLRIDTHEDNKVMQHVLEKYGFVRCGIVYVSDGSPRIAYELLEKSE